MTELLKHPDGTDFGKKRLWLKSLRVCYRPGEQLEAPLNDCHYIILGEEPRSTVKELQRVAYLTAESPFTIGSNMRHAFQFERLERDCTAFKGLISFIVYTSMWGVVLLMVHRRELQA